MVVLPGLVVGDYCQFGDVLVVMFPFVECCIEGVLYFPCTEMVGDCKIIPECCDASIVEVLFLKFLKCNSAFVFKWSVDQCTNIYCDAMSSISSPSGTRMPSSSRSSGWMGQSSLLSTEQAPAILSLALCSGCQEVTVLIQVRTRLLPGLRQMRYRH